MALVSDAGTPGISDPGLELVSAAAAAGFPVVPVPGPSSVVTALAVSGIPADRFLFLGFLPRSKGERQALLRSVAAMPFTLVIFEAPHRLQRSLADVREVLGDRRMTALREATKLHEEVFRGSVSEAVGALRPTQRVSSPWLWSGRLKMTRHPLQMRRICFALCWRRECLAERRGTWSQRRRGCLAGTCTGCGCA